MNIYPPRDIFIAIPVLLVGGTEMQTLRLVRTLAENDDRVTVCCYYEYDEMMVSRFEEAGADVILMKCERVDGLWRLVKELIRLFKEKKPDIVHVQYVAPGLVPIIAAKLSGINVIFATVHQPSRPYGLKAKLLLRFGAFLCTAFFCVSQSAEKSWFGTSCVLDETTIHTARNHFTIYNSIDEPYISKVINSINPKNLKNDMGISNCPVVGIVGRLRVEKGHSVLLDAIKEVVKKVPEVRLLVVGDGPDRDKLKRQADILGISNTVIWAGNKTQEEVFKLYSIMDVVAAPSLFEGFGLSAAEAMAASRPIIASALDGLNEIVENNVTGYLFPPGNSQILARDIVQLLSHPKESIKMGEKGRKRVKQYFSQNRFKRATLAVYHNFSKY